jgi:hypothetical protein
MRQYNTLIFPSTSEIIVWSRSAGYSLDLDNAEIAISDDRLEPGWYRIISAGETEMPTEAPGTFRCKNSIPSWLQSIITDSYLSIIEVKTISSRSFILFQPVVVITWI